MAVLTPEQEKVHIKKTSKLSNYYKSKKFCVIMDSKKVSDGFLISNPELIVKKGKDGRFFSGIGEILSSQLFNFIQVDSKLDGYVPIESEFTDRLGIGVRSLTKGGVSFTQSAFAQDTSNWSPDHVFESQKNIHFNIVTDIIDFPTVYFTTVTSQSVIKFAYSLKKEKYVRNIYYQTFFEKSLEELINSGGFKLINVAEENSKSEQLKEIE